MSWFWSAQAQPIQAAGVFVAAELSLIWFIGLIRVTGKCRLGFHPRNPYRIRLCLRQAKSSENSSSGRSRRPGAKLFGKTSSAGDSKFVSPAVRQIPPAGYVAE